MVTSVPSVKVMAFPISNFWSAGVKIGTDGRPNLK